MMRSGRAAPDFKTAPPLNNTRPKITEFQERLFIVALRQMFPLRTIRIHHSAAQILPRGIVPTGLTAEFEGRGILGTAFQPQRQGATKPRPKCLNHGWT